MNSEFDKEFFDQSSKAWLENKIKNGSMYFYRCNYIHSNNKRCNKPVFVNNFCKQHFKLKNKKLKN